MNFYKTIPVFGLPSMEIGGSFVLNSLLNRYNNKKQESFFVAFCRFDFIGRISIDRLQSFQQGK